MVQGSDCHKRAWELVGSAIRTHPRLPKLAPDPTPPLNRTRNGARRSRLRYKRKEGASDATLFFPLCRQVTVTLTLPPCSTRNRGNISSNATNKPREWVAFSSKTLARPDSKRISVSHRYDLVAMANVSSRSRSRQRRSRVPVKDALGVQAGNTLLSESGRARNICLDSNDRNTRVVTHRRVRRIETHENPQTHTQTHTNEHTNT